MSGGPLHSISKNMYDKFMKVTPLNELCAKYATNFRSQHTSVSDVDYAKMAAFDVLKTIIEKNKGAEVDKMTKIVLNRLPPEMFEIVEAGKREKSVSRRIADEQMQPSANVS